MKIIKYFFFAAIALMLFSAAPASQKAQAQVTFGISIGTAPACPYGYYGYRPYRCAPYGYYGPEWFAGGRFVGAGPWHQGPAFYGHVNRNLDPRYGYHGPYPNHGEYQEHPDHFQSFQGSHYADPRGRYHTEQQHSRYVPNNQHPR